MIVLVCVLQQACLIARLQQQGMSVVEVPTARPSAPEKEQQSLTYTKAKA